MSVGVNGDVILLYMLNCATAGRLTKSELLNFARFVEGDASGLLEDLDELAQKEYVKITSNNVVETVTITRAGTRHLAQEIRKLPINTMRKLKQLNPTFEISRRLGQVEAVLLYWALTIAVYFSPDFTLKSMLVSIFGLSAITVSLVLIVDLLMRQLFDMFDVVARYFNWTMKIASPHWPIIWDRVRKNLLLIVAGILTLFLFVTGYFAKTENIWTYAVVIIGILITAHFQKKSDRSTQPL